MSDPAEDGKTLSPEHFAKVREILLTVWDPIGVGDLAPDEYDTYVKRVCVMMKSEGATKDDVASYLHGVATEDMMLTDTPRRLSEAAAEAMFALKFELQGRLDD